MSIFSQLKNLFGNTQTKPTGPDDKINDSASMIINILAESLENKGRASSPEMLLSLGTLTGQLALRSKLGERIHSENSGDTILVPGVSDRVFELHNILKHNCEKGPLKKALMENVNLPEIEQSFLTDTIRECLPKIDAAFTELKLPDEHKDLAGVMAILIAIQNVKDEFNEDISGTLPYITHSMVAGSHIVIR